MRITDLRPANERAVRASAALVAQVTRGDLDRPTPCRAWTLGDLLAHMTAQHRGFAAAARGAGADPAVWQPRQPATDPAAEYAAAAAGVLSAFAAQDVPERLFDLPEFGPGATFPGAQAIGFHLVDAVVHAWDVARSLGVPLALGEDVAAQALPIAVAVPDGDNRLRPGAAFRPALPAPGNPSALDRILAALGRSPHWPA